MLFRSTILAALFAGVTASQQEVVPDFNIPTDSKMGKRLLSKARKLEQNNQNQEQDSSWLYGYSIKYDSCASLVQVREEGGGEEGLLYTQNLVKFLICPGNTGSCNDCGSGLAQYVVSMNDFITAYSEMKMTAKENACEVVRQNCYCDNANDDQSCENQCFVDAGLSDCIQYEGQDEFELDRYLECQALEGGNNNNNNNNNNNYYQSSSSSSNGVDMYRQYYIGPTCSSDGKSIFLSTFYDAGCTSATPSGVFEAFNYGASLPYAKESIVKKNDCISCLAVDENANNNNNQNYNGNYNYEQNYEVNEICQQSYEQAAKCESSKLSKYLGQYFYADESGCTFINSILPNLNKASAKVVGGRVSAASGSSAATAFAVIFGMTTALLGAYAFFLYRKIHRAKVNLAQAEMGMA